MNAQIISSLTNRIINRKALSYGLLFVAELCIGLFVVINYSASMAITAVAISIPLVLIRPKFGFLLCVLAVPFTGVHIFSIGDSNIEFIQPLLSLTCAAWFLNASAKVGPKFETDPRGINVTLLVFVLWIFITCTWSVSYFTGLFGLLKAIWVIALVPFTVSMIESHDDLKTALLTWSLVSVVVAAIGIFTETQSYSYLTGRAVGTAMHPNILAMYLSLSLFLLIGYHQLCGSSLAKALVLAAWAWDLAAMLATGSRGAVIGFLFGMLLICGRFIARRPGLTIVLPVAGIAGVVVFFALTSQMALENIIGRFVAITQGGEESMLALRLLIWGACYQMITASHWMGIGINSYAEVMNQYYVLDLLNLTHPHSFYLYILIELGVFGVCIFGVLVFFIIRQLTGSIRKIGAVRHQNALFSLSAGLAAFSVHGLIDFTIHDPQIWLYLGVTIAASRVLVKAQDRGEG